MERPYPLVAHRGAWREKGLPENSVAALRNALESDYMQGVECDIRTTVDGVMVISHPDSYGGKYINQNTYDVLNEYKQKNGEGLPRFEDFMQTLVKYPDSPVQLYVDIRAVDVVQMVRMVEKYDMQSRVKYLIWSEDVGEKLITLGYGRRTMWLSGGYTPAKVYDDGYGGIAYDNEVYKKHKGWVNEAKSRGLEVLVWTLDNRGDIIHYLNRGYMVITNKPYYFK